MWKSKDVHYAKMALESYGTQPRNVLLHLVAGYNRGGVFEAVVEENVGQQCRHKDARSCADSAVGFRGNQHKWKKDIVGWITLSTAVELASSTQCTFQVEPASDALANEMKNGFPTFQLSGNHLESSSWWVWTQYRLWIAKVLGRELRGHWTDL